MLGCLNELPGGQTHFVFIEVAHPERFNKWNHKKAYNEAKLISDLLPGSPLLTGRVEELSRAVGSPSGHWDHGDTVVTAGMVALCRAGIPAGQSTLKNCLL